MRTFGADNHDSTRPPFGGPTPWSWAVLGGGRRPTDVAVSLCGTDTYGRRAAVDGQLVCTSVDNGGGGMWIGAFDGVRVRSSIQPIYC